MSEPARAPDVESQLRAEGVAFFFDVRHHPYVVTAVVWIGAAIEGAILWPFSPHPRILLWLAMVSLCQAGSLLLILAWRRHRPAPEEAARWGRYKVIHTTALGLAWGLGVVLLHVPGVAPALLVPMLATVAMACAVTVTNASHPHGMYPLLFGNIVPGALYLLLLPGGGADETAAGSALLALLAVLLVGGRTTARVVRDAMLARIELAGALNEERSQRAEIERARAEAEAVSEETTHFFTAASHDLRQPVHALGLYISLLRKNPSEHERRELIERIASCAESLDHLFSAILGVSQASEVPGQLVLRAVPLQLLIAEAVVQFTPEARRKGLELRALPTSVWVRTHEASLRRILGNLVSNAIHYTEAGRVVIGVRRRRDGCALVVADTGIGIAAEHQGRVFADFFQVNNPGRDRRKGYGLGLATVRRLCDRMGCLIELQSTPGRGSLFAVRLEVAEEEHPAAPQPVPESTGADLHVLYVEDDALVRDAMQRLLESWQVPLRTCATGDEALAILREVPPRRWHALVDYRLADGENGLELASRLRSHFDPPPTISLITGEADPAVFAEAAQRGIGVLSKPVKPIRLRALLNTQSALNDVVRPVLSDGCQSAEAPLGSQQTAGARG